MDADSVRRPGNTGTRALACLLAIAPAAPAFAQLPEDLSGLLGRYGGSYVCGDREHGFYLDLTSLTPAKDGAGHAARGVIGFFPILSGLDDSGTGPTGSFIASGTLGPDGALSLRRDGDGWLFHALGYGAPNLDGQLVARTHGGFEIRGHILLSTRPDACGDFIATRFVPPAEVFPGEDDASPNLDSDT